MNEQQKQRIVEVPEPITCAEGERLKRVNWACRSYGRERRAAKARARYLARLAQEAR